MARRWRRCTCKRPSFAGSRGTTEAFLRDRHPLLHQSVANQSTKQSTDKPTDRPTDKPTNQQTDTLTKRQQLQIKQYQIDWFVFRFIFFVFRFVLLFFVWFFLDSNVNFKIKTKEIKPFKLTFGSFACADAVKIGRRRDDRGRYDRRPFQCFRLLSLLLLVLSV